MAGISAGYGYFPGYKFLYPDTDPLCKPGQYPRVDPYLCNSLLMRPRNMHIKSLTRRCHKVWRNTWRLNYFHRFTWKLERVFHSPLLVVGCIMKNSVTCNIGKQYISMGTIDLMFWITSRSISYLPCKNTDFEWLNTKLVRLRQKSVNNWSLGREN